MRKFLILTVLLFLMAQPCMAQMEKGDRELQASASMYAAGGFTLINITGTYGYFIKPRLQIGGGPNITRMAGYGFSNTTLGLSFFGRHYFTTTEKLVPYVAVQWYQFDLAPGDGVSFTDVAYLQVGGGAKYFINEYIAWDVSANFGFGLGGGTSFLLAGGLSAFF